MHSHENMPPEQASTFGLKNLPVWAWKDASIATVIVCLVALAALPYSKVALGDDATFVETALTFARTGHFAYVGWAAMPQLLQIVWVAPFLRLFGFTVPVIDVSTIVLGLLTVFVVHGVMARFDLSRRGTMIGTLTLCCSPLFLPLLVSFMTDVPGVLAIVVAFAMCQKAVLARTNRAMVIWIVAAGLTNVVLGSNRQICWLGVLVIVPATGWMLRSRRGALWSSLLTAAVGAVLVALTMRWYYAQPYTFREKLIGGKIGPKEIQHYCTQWAGAILLLALLVLPVVVGWLQQAGSLSRKAWLRTAGVTAFFVVGMVVLSHWPIELARATFPWLEPVIGNIGLPYLHATVEDTGPLSLAARAIITVLIVGMVWLVFEQAAVLIRSRRKRGGELGAVFWLVAPYTLAYMGAVSGRAMFNAIQDRYLLLLMPGVLISMIFVLEKRMHRRLTGVSLMVLVAMGLYGLAGTQMFQSYGGATLRLQNRLEATGIPRDSFSEDFGQDLREQVVHGGHVNHPEIPNPSNAWDPNVPHWDLPEQCRPGYDTLAPRIHPQYYFSGASETSCFRPTSVAPEPYFSLMPPFHRKIYLVRPRVDPGPQAP